MTPLTTTFVLTALAAVVVVLTRVRLKQAQGAGRISIPESLLNAHTAAGVLALATWVGYLAGLPWWVGAIALLLWWVTAVVGLLILARWLPAKGKHSSGPVADTWGEGPGLSVLAHVGMLVGTIVFTVLFALGSV